MKTLKNHDFVLAIISDSYLKSSNCMFEVGEILRDDSYLNNLLFIVLHDSDIKHYKNHINSIVGASIYSPTGKYLYIEYWQQQKEHINSLITNIQGNSTNTAGLRDELKLVEKILQNDIGVFYII